jgi:hypothetical protein
MIAALSGCASSGTVDKAPEPRASKPQNLYEWTDADTDHVAKHLAAAVVAGSWLERFVAEQQRKPSVAIARMTNRTVSHIPTTHIRDKLISLLTESGKVSAMVEAEGAASDFVLMVLLTATVDLGERIKRVSYRAVGTIKKRGGPSVWVGNTPPLVKTGTSQR